MVMVLLVGCAPTLPPLAPVGAPMEDRLTALERRSQAVETEIKNQYYRDLIGAGLSFVMIGATVFVGLAAKRGIDGLSKSIDGVGQSAKTAVPPTIQVVIPPGAATGS